MPLPNTPSPVQVSDLHSSEEEMAEADESRVRDLRKIFLAAEREVLGGDVTRIRRVGP